MSKNMKSMRFVALASLFLLNSCGPSSQEDFHEEGKKLTQQLIIEFSSIESRAELVNKSTRLQKIFDEMVSVMIAAREYREKNPHIAVMDISDEEHTLSKKLREEMNRIYKIEGCREIVERCQAQALQKLDLFEKRLEKRKFK